MSVCLVMHVADLDADDRETFAAMAASHCGVTVAWGGDEDGRLMLVRGEWQAVRAFADALELAGNAVVAGMAMPGGDA